MTAAVQWDEGTVHLRTTDMKGGVSYTEHRCWHVQNFIAGAHKRAFDADGKKLCTVEQITEKDYRKGAGLKPLRKAKK